MKSTVQIFIFLIMTNTLSAQEVRYYNKKGTETDLKKASYTETKYEQSDGHKIIVKQKPNKDSISYIIFSSNNPKIRDGKTILYYSSGKQHYVKYYQDNKLNGKLTRYYEEGRIESIVHLEGDSIISKKSFDKNGMEIDYILDTKIPKYQNQSMNNFRYFIMENVNYPQIAVTNKISAFCKVSFFVTETGQVTDIEVRTGIVPFKNEIIRVIKFTDGKWIPGEMYGEPSKIKLKMDLNFSIPE